jgi:hypothetical protein
MQSSRPCLPQFAWQLSDADKYAYSCLRATISTNTLRSPRNRRVLTFTETLEAIKNFVLRNDKDDGLRALLCGICWLPEGIAINTHQLRHLIPKCKSSINGSLQKLGYSMILGRTDCAQAMCNFFPLLRDNQAELRKWTIRKRTDSFSRKEDRGPVCRQSDPIGPRKVFEISLDGISRPAPATIDFPAVYEMDGALDGARFGDRLDNDFFGSTPKSWDLFDRPERRFEFVMAITDDFRPGISLD